MPMEPKDQIEYYFAVQQQILENIKFADQKAMVFIVINTSLLGAVYNTKVLSTGSPWLESMAVALMALLGLAVWFGVVVIRPRFRHGRARRSGAGYVDQSRIVNWRSRENEYKEAVAAVEYSTFRDDLAIFVLDQARRDEAKYYWLRWSILTSIAAWGLGLSFFLLAGFYLH
jgi:Pycsar effector protein